MPQPLTRLKGKDYSINFDAGKAFEKMPDLALLVSKCIATWSQVDMNLNRFLINMLGANSKVGMAILGALTSTVAHRDAVIAAADVVMPTGHVDRPLLDAALKVYTAQAKRRNKLAHHIWGYEQNTLDKLLLCDPNDMAEWALRLSLRPKSPPSGDLADLDDWVNSLAPDLSTIYWYTAKDLAAHLRDFKQTVEIWNYLAHISDQARPDWFPPVDGLRHQLSNLPLMVEASSP